MGRCTAEADLGRTICMVQRVRRQVHGSDLVIFGFCTCGRHAHAVFRAPFGESQVPSGRAIKPARALRDG